MTTAILLTRSVAENEKLKKKLAKYKVYQAPMLENSLCSEAISAIIKYTNIIITSKFAARNLAKLINWKANIFLVGKISAKIMADNKFVKTIHSFANVNELIEFLEHTNFHHEDFIYLSGDNITKTLPATIKRVIFYNTDYAESLSNEVIAAFQKMQINIILLYSVNSAKKLFQLAEKYNIVQYLDKIAVIALSDSIAEICKPFVNEVIICNDHSNKAMIKLVNDYEQRDSKK